MSFVAIDLGVSSSRFTSNARGGNCISIPNRMTLVENSDGSFDPKPIDITKDDDSLINNIEVIIEKDGCTDGMYPRHIVSGPLVARFNGISNAPQMQQGKVKQNIHYYNAIMCVACDLAMTAMNGAIPDSDITLFVTLPPDDEHASKDEFVQKLKGKYRVKFLRYPDANGVPVQIEFCINHMAVTAESKMAVFSWMYGMDLKRRPETLQYNGNTILSVDIGESTTDFYASKDGKFYDKSGISVKTGCGAAKSRFSDYMYETDSSVRITGDRLDDAFIEGRVKLGFGQYSSCEKELMKAKREIARKIYDEFSAQLAGRGMNMSNFDLVLMSGGGAMPSMYVEDGVQKTTVDSIADYLFELMKQQNNYIVKLEYPGTPRSANINGLLISARIKEAHDAEVSRTKQQSNEQAVAKAEMEKCSTFNSGSEASGAADGNTAG